MSLLERHGLTVATYATWIGPSNVARACELARGLGVDVIGGGCRATQRRSRRCCASTVSGSRSRTTPSARPHEVLAKIERRRRDVSGATVDTGWWATQGYDAGARDRGARRRTSCTST